MSVIKGRPKYKGKFVKLDFDNSTGLGICDRSGFIFNHNDLVKQYEWRGNSLVWTGLMVGKPFLDEPNEQARPPVPSDDPRPLKNPRPSTPYNDCTQNPSPPYPQIIAAIQKISFTSNNGEL